MESLRQYLSSVPSGEIGDTDELESLLSEHWGEFQLPEQEGGMAAYKLKNRMEKVTWTPPNLEFNIERHGGAARGSSRAEMQHWTIDLKERIASWEGLGFRQIEPTADRFFSQPLVEEVVQAILANKPHKWIEWNDDGSVFAKTAEVFPVRSAKKETLSGRRKSFREKLEVRLKIEGWSCERRRGKELCVPPTRE
jgi:hypothetical protein